MCLAGMDEQFLAVRGSPPTTPCTPHGKATFSRPPSARHHTRTALYLIGMTAIFIAALCVCGSI